MADNLESWELVCYPSIVVVNPIDVSVKGEAGVRRVFADGRVMRHDGGDPGDEHVDPPPIGITLEYSYDGVRWEQR